MVGVSFQVSDPLCLKLGQRSGDDVPVNLLRCYSLKKGQGPKAQLSPSESGPWLTGVGGSLQGSLPLRGVFIQHSTQSGSSHSAQVWLKRPISAGGTLQARSPGPAQLSWLRGWVPRI